MSRVSSSLKREPYSRCVITKPDPNRDYYVARALWGDEEWSGTRSEAEALGISRDRIQRASETGSSSRTGAFGWRDRTDEETHVREQAPMA